VGLAGAASLVGHGFHFALELHHGLVVAAEFSASGLADPSEAGTPSAGVGCFSAGADSLFAGAYCLFDEEDSPVEEETPFVGEDNLVVEEGNPVAVEDNPVAVEEDSQVCSLAVCSRHNPTMSTATAAATVLFPHLQTPIRLSSMPGPTSQHLLTRSSDPHQLRPKQHSLLLIQLHRAYDFRIRVCLSMRYSELPSQCPHFVVVAAAPFDLVVCMLVA